MQIFVNHETKRTHARVWNHQSYPVCQKYGMRERKGVLSTKRYERESITWWSVLLMETTGVPGKNCSVYSQTIAISFEKIIRSLCNHIIYKHNNSPFLNFYFKGEASHISLRWWSFHVQDNFVIMTSDTLVFCKYRE